MLIATRQNAVRVARQGNPSRTLARVSHLCKLPVNSASVASFPMPVESQLVLPSSNVDLIKVQPNHGVYTLTAENFYQFLEEAQDKLVVVDFFAEWCGPCKMIYPAVEQMAQDYEDVLFAKVDCGKNERRFLTSLGIRALPTFFLYKGNQKVGEMVGGTAKSLNSLVCNNRA